MAARKDTVYRHAATLMALVALALSLCMVLSPISIGDEIATRPDSNIINFELDILEEGREQALEEVQIEAVKTINGGIETLATIDNLIVASGQPSIMGLPAEFYTPILEGFANANKQTLTNEQTLRTYQAVNAKGADVYFQETSDSISQGFAALDGLSSAFVMVTNVTLVDADLTDADVKGQVDVFITGAAGDSASSLIGLLPLYQQLMRSQTTVAAYIADAQEQYLAGEPFLDGASMAFAQASGNDEGFATVDLSDAATLGAVQTTIEQYIDGVMDQLLPLVPLYGASVDDIEDAASRATTDIQDEYNSYFDNGVSYTRTAVALAMIAVVGFHLALGMLLAEKESYVAVAFQVVGCLATPIYLIMLKLISDETDTIIDLTIELRPTYVSDPPSAAGPAAYCAGFALAFGIAGSVFTTLAIRYSPKSIDSKDSMLEMDDAEQFAESELTTLAQTEEIQTVEEVKEVKEVEEVEEVELVKTDEVSEGA